MDLRYCSPITSAKGVGGSLGCVCVCVLTPEGRLRRGALAGDWEVGDGGVLVLFRRWNRISNCIY